MNDQANKTENRTESHLTRTVSPGKFLRLFVPVLFCALGFPALFSGQDPPPDKQSDPARVQSTPTPDSADKTTSEQTPPDQAKSKKPKRGSWILAPIPIQSPAFGSGMILGVGYVFKFKESDKASPPSTLGAAFAFTGNGSRGVVIAGNLRFSENKYQATFALARGRANYEFYGIGRIPSETSISTLIKQHGSVVFGEFMRNFGKGIFIGPRYQYRKLTVDLGDRTTSGGFEIPPIDVRSTTAAIGFHVQRDLRDSTFYPTKGSLWDVKADFFGKALGSNRTYQTFSAAYNGYRTVGKGQVLAYRAMACSSSDDAPFFDLCLFGTRGDLRGYTGGEFQDHRMFATQLEYRRELPWRLGLVGFAGVGSVARTWDKMRFDGLLPAGGLGLRFMVDKTNHINYRIDLGFGRTGHTLSMSVTEAF